MFKLMYIGNIGYSQDFNGIIKILKILKKRNFKISFVVIGDGRDMKNVFQKVKEENLKNYIYFLGRIKKEYIKNYASYSSMLFLSLRKNELFDITIPAKFQTYLSLNKPIFGVISGETAKLISSLNCGISINSGEYKNAANMIIKIIKNKTCLKKFYNKKDNTVMKKLRYENVIMNLKKIIDQ